MSGETEAAGARPRDKESPGETHKGGSTATIPGRHSLEREVPGIGVHFTVPLRDPGWTLNKSQDQARPITGGSKQGLPNLI